MGKVVEQSIQRDSKKYIVFAVKEAMMNGITIPLSFVDAGVDLWKKRLLVQMTC